MNNKDHHVGQLTREHVVYHLAILLVFTTCEGFLLGALSANANTLNRWASLPDIVEHNNHQLLTMYHSALEQESIQGPIQPAKV